MKKISVIVPCYNEENSIREFYDIVKRIFEVELQNYNYDIIFVDDFSKDNTRKCIKELCKEDPLHVKGVFNAANFGFSRNVFSALQLMDGDAAFLTFGDLQDPPELLPAFVEKWQNDSRVVIGKKKSSKENSVMFFFRKVYYKLINVLSDKDQIDQYTGFGLYDKSFIEILKQIDDIEPYLKQVIAEYAPDYEVVCYEQNLSNRGTSNFNLYRNFDFAMQGITSSTKKLMRLSTFCGITVAICCAFYALSVIIKKILFWDSYPFGMASITVGIFFIGALQLFFIGILGEYVLSINTKTLRRPRVIIGEKINFDIEEK